MSNTAPISIVVAGTTERTVQCLRSLASDERVVVAGIITPAPKPIGRKKIITENPVHRWATDALIPVVLVEHTLQTMQPIILNASQFVSAPDILLVVDFGYLVPEWLLNWPKVAPINIHPSALPRWRGSAPGQFVLLHGEQESAVSIIKMTAAFDQGSIISQIPFSVNDQWTQNEYYDFSFRLVGQQLSDTLIHFVRLPTALTAQPERSPTPTARRVTKDDTFLPWNVLSSVLASGSNTSVLELQQTNALSPILADALASANGSYAVMIERAVRAFYNWPALWTRIPTTHGELRMKILSSELVQNTLNGDWAIELLQVCIEGKSPTQWKNVANTLLKLESSIRTS